MNELCVTCRPDSGGEVEPGPTVLRDRRTGRHSGRHAAGCVPCGHAQDPAAQVRRAHTHSKAF